MALTYIVQWTKSLQKFKLTVDGWQNVNKSIALLVWLEYWLRRMILTVSTKKLVRVFILFLFGGTLFVFVLYTIYEDVCLNIKFYRRTEPNDGDIILRYDGRMRYRGKGEIPTILFWTDYYGQRWTDTQYSDCQYRCKVSHDRKEVIRADAVLFHFYYLKQDDLPMNRSYDQIWIFLNQEPPSKITVDLGRYKHVFNWTASYRRDSKVIFSYGQIVKRKDRRQSTVPPIEQKSEFAFAAVSNRFDEAQRYKILDDFCRLNSNVRLFGKFYQEKCEVKGHKCLSKATASKYFFKFAFENNNCKDYVTEKYWNALDDGVIPVVNWWPEQIPSTLIPNNSYINIYDFANISDVYSHMIQVTLNKTLFNAYNAWRAEYTVDISDQGACSVCKELHKNHSRQSLDVEKWLQNDICYPYTVSLMRCFYKSFHFKAFLYRNIWLIWIYI